MLSKSCCTGNMQGEWDKHIPSRHRNCYSGTRISFMCQACAQPVNSVQAGTTTLALHCITRALTNYLALSDRRNNFAVSLPQPQKFLLEQGWEIMHQILPCFCTACKPRLFFFCIFKWLYNAHILPSQLTKPNIFTTWLFTEKVCQPLCWSLGNRDGEQLLSTLPVLAPERQLQLNLWCMQRNCYCQMN